MKKKMNIRRKITRFFLTITTVVVLAMVTLASCTILYTQIRMGSFYNSIENAEDARDWNQEQAGIYSGQIAKYYQSQADSYDTEVRYLENVRSAMMSSSNPIVAWAAKNQFEVSILFLGLGLTLISGIAWVMFKKYKRQVLNVEEKLFNSIMYLVFMVLTFLCCALFLLFRKVAMAQKPRYKKTVCKNVIPIAKKRRAG